MLIHYWKYFQLAKLRFFFVKTPKLISPNNIISRDIKIMATAAMSDV